MSPRVEKMWIGVGNNLNIYNLGDVIFGGFGSTYNYQFSWDDQSGTPGRVSYATRSSSGFLTS